MRRMMGVVLFAGLACTSPALATEIEHRAIDCVVAGSFPRLQARFVPSDGVGRARVHFRADQGPYWYTVNMERAPDGFAATLPKPRESLKRFVYYIEVIDTTLGTNRTAEFTPIVVSGAGACKDKVVAGTLGSATVALEVPVGAPLVPAGFASSGVASVAGAAPVGATAESGAGSAGGGSASSGAAVGAAGAGVNTALIIGAGVAAAAGVAVAVSGGGSSDGSGSGTGGGGTGGGSVTPGTTPANPSVYNVTFLPSPPGIDVSVCGGRSLTWCCQNVSAPNGTFDTTWAPSQPNTMRVTGTVNETTFSATLACVSGSGSGSIQASGSGGSYQGTWSFAGQSGTASITRVAP